MGKLSFLIFKLKTPLIFSKGPWSFAKVCSTDGNIILQTELWIQEEETKLTRIIFNEKYGWPVVSSWKEKYGLGPMY